MVFQKFFGADEDVKERIAEFLDEACRDGILATGVEGASESKSGSLSASSASGSTEGVGGSKAEPGAPAGEFP
jgi:hypothetical protein